MMFEFLFGAAWIAFTGLFTFLLYGVEGGTITVNGEYVSRAEFNSMLGPKIFIGIFFLIGILVCLKGLKKLIANKITKIKGIETYGCILNVYPNGCRVNSRSLYDADILILKEDRTLEIFRETIGMKTDIYYPGVFVKAQYYDKDANILQIVERLSIPNNILTDIELELENNPKYNIYEIGGRNKISECNSDYVIIDGVKYKRED